MFTFPVVQRLNDAYIRNANVQRTIVIIRSSERAVMILAMRRYIPIARRKSRSEKEPYIGMHEAELANALRFFASHVSLLAAH